MEIANIPSDSDRNLVCNGQFRAIPIFSEALLQAQSQDPGDEFQDMPLPAPAPAQPQPQPQVQIPQKGGRSTKKMNKRKSKNKSRHARY
jgi:hypothetical protein